MRAGGAFSGVGYAELGLEWAGIPSDWLIEEKPWRRALLRQRFAEAEVYSDVRFVDPPFDLDPVDIIAAGFPCQDVSYAGKRKGLVDGSRTGLWFHLREIIRHIRPSYVLLENVVGLLTAGFDIVLGDLAALGYDAQWSCVPMSALGAPHRRDRLWIVGHPRPGFSQRLSVQRRRAVADSHGERSVAGLDPLEVAGRMAGRRAHGLRHPAGDGGLRVPDEVRLADRADIFSSEALAAFARHCQQHVWSAEPRVGRVAARQPNGMDRLRALGDSLTPVMTQFLGWRIRAHAGEL